MSTNGRNQFGDDGQLGSTDQKHPVCHHFQTATVPATDEGGHQPSKSEERTFVDGAMGV